MEDLCVADGMNRFSFHAFVSWSPVIAHTATASTDCWAPK